MVSLGSCINLQPQHRDAGSHRLKEAVCGRGDFTYRQHLQQEQGQGNGGEKTTHLRSSVSSPPVPPEFSFEGKSLRFYGNVRPWPTPPPSAPGTGASGAAGSGETGSCDEHVPDLAPGVLHVQLLALG